MELTRKILQRRPALPVILYTGHSEIITKEKAKANGVSYFLLKPVTPGELLKTIRNLLDKKTAGLPGKWSDRQTAALALQSPCLCGHGVQPLAKG